MSHHQDSAAAKQDPRLGISDVYLFKGESGTVFVMNTNPVSADKGFHPEAMFEIVLNAPVTMGLDAGHATGMPRAEFPYLSEPA